MDQLASKTFTWEDQHWFARTSGDHNPMHMDPLFARRTQAGRPVVHGMHSLLFSLEALLTARPLPQAVVGVVCKFLNMVYPGDSVTVFLNTQTEESITVQAKIEDLVVLSLTLHLKGEIQETTLSGKDEPPLDDFSLASPLVLDLTEMQSQAGALQLQGESALALAFPNAARKLGAARIAGLAGLSRLVGMVCPGLHSIFFSIDLTAISLTDSAHAISYAVESVDERFRLVKQNIRGAGWEGSVDAFVRVPPVKQLSLAEIAPLVAPDEFIGCTALVVGASRGLGEVAAKIIAAGGGAVVATYAVGKTETEELAAEIQQWGGKCDIVHYDAREDPQAQLQGIATTITHLYYFATPPVPARKTKVIDHHLFQKFMEVYNYGFVELCSALALGNGGRLTALYPSSVYVGDGRPRNLTEYAMAKAAGEILCADFVKHNPKVRILVRRLPRVLTDLTASVTSADGASGVEVLLPILREMNHKP